MLLVIQLWGLLVSLCIGFAWQGFGSGRATGVASVRTCQKLPLCPMIEPMSATSKTDPLLAKAEPISDGGSASGITDLKKGKSYCAAAIAARRQD